MSTAVEDLFPTAHWTPSDTARNFSDSNTGGQVLQSKGAFVESQMAAQHTDPTSGTVNDLFKGPAMPTLDPYNITVPGSPNDDPLKRLYRG